LSEKSNFYLPSIQAVLFDIDGTLVDTEDLHFASWNEILTEYEMVLDRRHYDLNFVGLTSVDIVLRNFAHLPVAARESLPERKESLFRTKLSALTPTKGLVAFLKPDPMPYAEGLMQLGVEAGQAFAYEDSIVGVTSSVAAGIATIGVDAAGHHPIEGHPLLAVGAGRVVRDFVGEWHQIEAARR